MFIWVMLLLYTEIGPFAMPTSGQIVGGGGGGLRVLVVGVKL